MTHEDEHDSGVSDTEIEVCGCMCIVQCSRGILKRGRGQRGGGHSPPYPPPPLTPILPPPLGLLVHMPISFFSPLLFPNPIFATILDTPLSPSGQVIGPPPPPQHFHCFCSTFTPHPKASVWGAPWLIMTRKLLLPLEDQGRRKG